MSSAGGNFRCGLTAAASVAAPTALLQWRLAEGEVPTHVGFRCVDGVRVRYAATDRPDAPTIVLTSPWPESIRAFDSIWDTLASRFRLLAVDLPGFGASERRADLLSPHAMGTFLVRLIEEFELHHPHLVAPDIGTSAALFAAADSPAAMASVVVGAGGAAVPIELGEPLRSWVLDPDLERFRSMDSGAIVSAALDSVEGHAFTPAVRDDYLDSYAGDRFAESMRYVRRYPEELPLLARRLAEVDTPVLVFAGLRDPVVPLANAEFLAARLPRNRLATIDAGHFVWEEAPAAFAALIADWVAGGHLRPELSPNPTMEVAHEQHAGER